MSATPASDPPTYPEPTQADRDVLFASVVWFRQQEWAGLADQYQGKFVAVLGDQVIDADAEKDELVRRLEARGRSVPMNRVVLQYVHRPEDWNWK